MIKLPDIKKIKVEINQIKNELLKKRNISLSVLRLDKIDPHISGNKFFKLYFFLKQAVLQDKKIITYCTGGIKCEKASAFLLEKGFETLS